MKRCHVTPNLRAALGLAGLLLFLVTLPAVADSELELLCAQRSASAPGSVSA